MIPQVKVDGLPNSSASAATAHNSRTSAAHSGWSDATRSKSTGAPALVAAQVLLAHVPHCNHATQGAGRRHPYRYVRSGGRHQRQPVPHLDLVLADVPVSGDVKVRAFNHPLGECGLTLFAAPALARKYRKGFPASLDGAPMLMPTEDSAMRRSLEQWFESIDVRPRIVAEFDDSGLLKSFGQEGEGIFFAPSVVEDDVRKNYGVHVVGRTDAVVERFFAITVERRIKNPAVAAISESAKQNLFRD